MEPRKDFGERLRWSKDLDELVGQADSSHDVTLEWHSGPLATAMESGAAGIEWSARRNPVVFVAVTVIGEPWPGGGRISGRRLLASSLVGKARSLAAGSMAAPRASGRRAAPQKRRRFRCGPGSRVIASAAPRFGGAGADHCDDVGPRALSGASRAPCRVRLGPSVHGCAGSLPSHSGAKLSASCRVGMLCLPPGRVTESAAVRIATTRAARYSWPCRRAQTKAP